MKKIGLISFSVNTSSLNYGAVLHAWAMQRYLKTVYPTAQVDVIDYIPVHLVDHNYNFPFITYTKKKQYKQAIKNFLLYVPYTIRYKRFKRFIARNFALSDRYDYYSLKNADLAYDTYICESDVIWAAGVCAGRFDDNFFLNFASAENKRRIAYSPSLSDGNMTSGQEQEFADYLGKLHYISCRESYAKKIIEKHTDLEVTHVMDPVFLPDREDYLRFIKKEKPAQKYIFIYLPVGLNKTLLKEAITYAKKNNFEVLEYTSSIHFFSGHRARYSPGIEDFLSAIYYSERVFTNSFHAICFSLLFEKEFYAFNRKYSGKVADICRTMGVEDHYFPDDIFVDPKTIDYKHVNDIISKYREISRKWITDAINA